MHYYRSAKKEIAAREEARKKAELARQRHEAHEARLHREKREKAIVKPAPKTMPKPDEKIITEADEKKAAIAAAVARVVAKKPPAKQCYRNQTMEFETTAAPHLQPATSVTRVMGEVIVALIPAFLGLVWFFGRGIVINLTLAVMVAWTTEAAVLAARDRPVVSTLRDLSATVTAVLLAMALPPAAPWWLTTTATVFAIIFAKQLYGGLGFNPFNPAMVGYVLVLVSFPREMTDWLPPNGIDALSQATPLDLVRQQVGQHRPIVESLQGWQWIALLYLAGGLWLLWRRTIAWQIPIGMLGALFFFSGFFHLLDPTRYASPLFHLLSGASLSGAFFIATDPVSASTTPRGRIFFGIGIGILVYVIRTFGGYPDAVAFAVLLMNMAVPTIDHYTRPQVYGTLESAPNA